MAEAPEQAPRSAFLAALERLHERFLVDADGVTEVWLIRHGDAYTELRSLDDSRIDPPLSPQGRAEAEKLGRRLAASGISAVWCSNLMRAQETAEIAAARSGIMPRVDGRLREVKTRWDAGAEAANEVNPGYIPFVEPLDEVLERLNSVMAEIIAEHAGQRVAVVSHAGAIGMYLMQVLKLDSGPLRMLPRYTSVSVILHKGESAVVQSIGDIGHLVREGER